MEGRYGIGVQAVVTQARFRGMGQHIANLFQLDLKQLAQREIDRTLAKRNVGYAIPRDLRRFVQFDDVRFSKQSNGVLGVSATGSVTVQQSDIATLCKRLDAC